MFTTETHKNDIDQGTGIKKLKILFLGGKDNAAVLLHNIIKREGIVHNVRVVHTKRKFEEALPEFCPDVIIADCSAASFPCSEAVEITARAQPQIPVIRITMALPELSAVELLHNGVDDYLPVSTPDQLAVAISNCLDKVLLEKERRHTLDDLRLKESRLRALMENIDEGAIILSASAKFMYASPSMQRLLGYDDAELLQLDVFMVTHPSEIQLLTDLLQQALASPGISLHRPEARLSHKNGTWRWVAVTFTNRLHDEAIAGITGSIRDITAYKAAEESAATDRKLAQAMQASEAYMHAFLDNSSDGFLLADTNGTIQFFNNKCGDIIYLNAGHEVKIGNSIYDYIPESRKSDYRQRIAEVLLGNVYQYDYSFTRQNGEIKWFSFTINPVRAGGNITGISITAADLSLRKQAEAQLQESEAFSKGVLASLSSNIAVINDRGEILAVNKAWDDYRKKNGEPPIEKTSEGSNYFDVCRKAGAAGEHYATEALKGIASVFSNEKASFDLEYPCDSPHEKLWYNIHVQQLGNDPSKVVIAHQDVTERKNAEAALRESESNLQAIFDNTSEGFILLDLNGRVTTFNKKAAEIILLNLGENIRAGDSIFQYVPESKKTFAKNIIPLVSSGENVQYDIPFVKESGAVKWFSLSITQVIKSGVIAGFSITAQDMTERKVMEDLLMRSKLNLSAIIENTDSFIYSLDTNLRYIIYNTSLFNTLKNVYGITIYQGYQVLDFVRQFEPEAVQEWTDAYTKSLNGEVVNFDKEYLIGEYYSYTSFSIHPIWEHGKVIGLSCFVNDRTKEKLAEKSVRQSELRYRQIVETAQEGIWLVGEDNKTVFVNRKLCEILGYREDEFIGKDIYEFMDDEGRQLALQAMEGKKKGISGNAAFKYISKSGDQVWTNISANPIFDESGTYRGALAMISDITDKRKLETLLDATNNMARIGNYEADLQKSTIYWSAMTKEIHEVNDEFVPKLDNLTAFYKKGASRQRIIKAYAAVKDENAPFDLELEIVTAKGNVRWVRLIGKGKFLDGRCISIYGSFQDIDKVKRAELELLKASEEKIVILESIGDAFFAIDKQWIVTYWNKEAERLLGQTRHKMIGNSLWEVFPDSVDSTSHKQYRQAIETGVAVSFNDYEPHLNKWFEISAFPSAAGLSVYFKDVTLRKQSEIERTKILADITQRNKDLEQFSYIVSHNLRAPVANIIGLLDELNYEGHNNDIKAMFTRELLANVKLLDGVIIDLNGILQTKREISEKKEAVIFSRLVDNIKSSIKNLIQKEQAVIKTDFTQASQFTTVKSYLYSIFYNLISNSIKYRQPGIHPVIEIRARETGGKLVITFKDNGRGIDLEKKGDLVFGLYKRFHRDIEGKGMGLFMVKTQVETLGGKISIQSAVNEGTEFTITFEV